MPGGTQKDYVRALIAANDKLVADTTQASACNSLRI